MPRAIRQLVTKVNGTRFDGSEIHLRQGDLDGACGPYCLAMALIALGLTDKYTLCNGFYHGNSNIARFIRELENRRGQYFFRNGTDKKDFEAAVNASFPKHIRVDYLDNQAKGQHLRDFINGYVNNGVAVSPVIVGINFGKNALWGHWVLVVGHESDADGIERYLLLDPGADAPRTGECWNATMEAVGRGSPLPYLVRPNRGTEYRVALTDAVSLV